MDRALKSIAFVACVTAPFMGVGSVKAQALVDGSGCQAVESSYCVPAGGSVSLLSSTGAVSIIRDASAVSGGTGTELVAGDRIVIEDGSALVSLAPTCQISVTNFSSANISTSNGLTCVTLGGVTQTTSTESSSTTGLLVGGATLGGAAALAYGLSNESEGSP